MLRVRLTATLCALPPGTKVMELGLTLLMMMLAVPGGATVRLNEEVTEVTPLPLAVMVMD